MNRFLRRWLRRTSSLRIHALAALFLAGYVASFAHDVSVRHSICADHGEWVHDSSATGEATGATDSDDGSARIRSAPQRTESAHEHCTIVVATRGGRWLAPSAPITVAAPVFEGVREIVAIEVFVPEVRIGSAPARGPPTSV